MRSKRIYALIAVAIALVAVIWIDTWQSAAQTNAANLERKAEQARQLASFFERQTTSTFRYADSYLKLVRREYLSNPSPVVVQALVNEVPLDRAIVSHVTIIDALGTPIFNSAYPIKPGTSAKDRGYFKIQRAATDDNLHVSLPLRGRNSDRLLLRLVRRITLPDGAFGGVIFAALDVGSVTEFFTSMNLGPKSSATLVGKDKKIRARSTYGPLGPGQDISDSRLWSELDKSPVGLYRQVSVVDSIARHYAYRQLTEFPLIVAIGIGDDDSHGEVAGISLPNFSIALLTSILIITASILFIREVLASARLRASDARIRAMNDALEVRVQQRTAELEKTQHELLRKQRLAVLGQLTGTVAHELRNPLGTILTSVTAIEQRLANSPVDLGPTVERVRRNVARCNTIITELLDFTRITELDLQPTEVDPWVTETVRELAESAEIPIRCEPGAHGVVINIDTERVRRALINLLDNARDALEAAPAAGAIVVLTRSTAQRVEIEVHDPGPGIPESLRESIHEPLFSTKSFGIGLGLPVVNQVMEDHQGGFTIDSEPGCGTRAILWFDRQRDTPRSSAPDRDSRSPSPSSSASGRPRK